MSFCFLTLLFNKWAIDAAGVFHLQNRNNLCVYVQELWWPFERFLEMCRPLNPRNRNKPFEIPSYRCLVYPPNEKKFNSICFQYFICLKFIHHFEIAIGKFISKDTKVVELFYFYYHRWKYLFLLLTYFDFNRILYIERVSFRFGMCVYSAILFFV